MAKKTKKGSMKSNSYDPNFFTPLSAQKAAGEPGPEVLNNPVLTPSDPLGFAPGGLSEKGSISKGKF